MSKPIQNKLLFCLLIGLFLAQFLFISPKGEFALNDDWVHTDTIKHWVEAGSFRLMPYAGPTFYVPILYGAALVKIFGFSFTLLRISTLAIALISILLLFLFLVKLTHRPALAFVGALTLWLNPIFFNLSFTFMTDIPALLFLILSIYFYYSAFENKSSTFPWKVLDKKWRWFFVGSLFSIIGFYTRQTNILILIAAGLYALKEIKQIHFKNLLLGFGLPLAIGGTIYSYLTIYNLLPQSVGAHTIETIPRLLGHIKWWLWYTPIYLGLFVLPLTSGWLLAHLRHLKNKMLWLSLASFVSAAVLIRQVYHLQFPYVDNMISLYGLGPMKSVIAGNLKLLAPSWVWGIITLIAAASLALLIFILSKRHNNQEPADARPERGRRVGFIYLFGWLYLIPILVFKSFDRYFLPLLLVLIIALTQNLKHLKFNYLVAILILIPIGAYNITQTDYYLKWNQARWELANSVLKQGVSAEQIDGGYEWDGWNSYWPAANSGIKNGPKTAPWWIYQIFTNNTRNYAVSFGPLAGYTVVDMRKIEPSNPNGVLFILQKKAGEKR
ncbi:MAG: glycosyltransferase family 39 protein [Candidatus Magasanikbacteria bacterium]|nr:glycosyltransferase family 39 protein [Candidatus Magasanikbacteria bacterium]